MKINNITKYKPCKHAKLSKVEREVSEIEIISKDTSSPRRIAYNLHQVPVSGETYLVADAKTLNRETNQSGRGNLRYLLDRSSKKYLGIAKELDDGSYRRVI